MKVNFELEINRSLGRRDEKPMSVRIADRTSGCRILEVNFGLADFMEILTGMGGITAEGEFSENAPIGCTKEHKEETVDRPTGRDQREAESIVADLEVDGWMARLEDIHNAHRWTGDKKVRVTFTRFIRPDGSVWMPK